MLLIRQSRRGREEEEGEGGKEGEGRRANPSSIPVKNLNIYPDCTPTT